MITATLNLQEKAEIALLRQQQAWQEQLKAAVPTILECKPADIAVWGFGDRWHFNDQGVVVFAIISEPYIFGYNAGGLCALSKDKWVKITHLSDIVNANLVKQDTLPYEVWAKHDQDANQSSTGYFIAGLIFFMLVGTALTVFQQGILPALLALMVFTPMFILKRFGAHSERYLANFKADLKEI
jgi:hypothetical protein